MSTVHTPATAASAPRPLATLAGPRGIPVLGNAHQIDSTRFHLQLEAWEKQYGRSFGVRIASRHFLVVSDPEVIGTVLRQRPETFRRTPRLEEVSRELGFYGLFSANGESWRRQRPMVLAGLDPAHIRNFLPAMADVTQRLQQRWKAAAQGGTPVDLLADLMRYTVDVTTGLAFGRNLDTLGQGDDTAIQQHLNVILPALFRRILAPVDVRRWIKDKSTARHAAALHVEVRAFVAQARAQLQERPGLREKPDNLIQALIAARDREGSGVSDEEVSGNVLTMLLAGEDTTANTLAWMIWLLHRNPAASKQAQHEVDRLVPRGGIVRTMDQLMGLDDVEACAHEAMRLKPVAPLIAVQALNDVVVAGVQVPRGAYVMCLMRPPGMDPAHFPEPENFSLARWRSRGDGAVKAMSSAKRLSMPFGAGPRICPGRYLALAEIKMVAAMLLSTFEIEEVSAPGGEPAERLSLTMSPVGLQMKLRPRA